MLKCHRRLCGYNCDENPTACADSMGGMTAGWRWWRRRSLQPTQSVFAYDLGNAQGTNFLQFSTAYDLTSGAPGFGSSAPSSTANSCLRCCEHFGRQFSFDVEYNEFERCGIAVHLQRWFGREFFRPQCIAVSVASWALSILCFQPHNWYWAEPAYPGPWWKRYSRRMESTEAGNFTFTTHIDSAYATWYTNRRSHSLFCGDAR